MQGKKPRLRSICPTRGMMGSPPSPEDKSFLPVPTEVTGAIERLVKNVFIHSFIVIVCLHEMCAHASQGTRYTFLPSYEIGDGILADRLSGKRTYH